MTHLITTSGYSELVDRLNRFPQGAPPSDLLFKILKLLFSEKEAALVSLMPIYPFTAEKAARIWKMNVSRARKILHDLASRAILVDIEQNSESAYCLPPPMAGFFEFALMRVRGDLDQKMLSELFYQYLNVEDAFIRDLFTRGETQLGRAFVHEPALTKELTVQVLDYERATEVIATATHIGVGVCYCRHKMKHVNRSCDAPMNICMTFNTVAASLIKHGHARRVDQKEGLDLLQLAYENRLVQFGDNVKRNVCFICNCCGCCCEAMIAARRFGVLHPVHTTNFIPEVQTQLCVGCGKCVGICPVEAMTLVSANDPRTPNKKTAKLREDICLGCGLCVRACTRGNVVLKPRAQRVITPLDSTHRIIVMAIERGTLQHLIFDNRVLWSHRALAAVLGVILKIPPIQQVMASEQVKSRYLESLLTRVQHYR
ncbi:MAG: 4Fe-4S dicluster domain-containing protein [Deltaproteobacteria bacterium]|nr:4Fe-4S dicluster domain-containing protein [Deltaproteobacteria bacterium]